MINHALHLNCDILLTELSSRATKLKYKVIQAAQRNNKTFEKITVLEVDILNYVCSPCSKRLFINITFFVLDSLIISISAKCNKQNIFSLIFSIKTV